MFYKPADKIVSKRKLLNAYAWNHDGFGMMWIEDGRVKTNQAVYNSLDIIELYNEHKHRNLAVHFRYSTAGTVSDENTHPFKILDKEVNGFDLYVMHNGVLSGLPDIPEERSDTYQFVTEYIKPILESNPDLIYKKEFIHFMRRAIGNHNKLLFMSSRGDVIIVNSSAGRVIDGIWYSNLYSIYAPKITLKKARKGKVDSLSSLDRIRELVYATGCGMFLQEDETDGLTKYYTMWEVEHRIEELRNQDAIID